MLTLSDMSNDEVSVYGPRYLVWKQLVLYIINYFKNHCFVPRKLSSAACSHSSLSTDLKSVWFWLPSVSHAYYFPPSRLARSCPRQAYCDGGKHVLPCVASPGRCTWSRSRCPKPPIFACPALFRCWIIVGMEWVQRFVGGQRAAGNGAVLIKIQFLLTKMGGLLCRASYIASRQIWSRSRKGTGY